MVNLKSRILFLLLSAFSLQLSALCQHPQAQTGQPLYPVNAKYVQGVGPGYWPTAGSGLTLNLAAGTATCNAQAVNFAGGTLSLAPSATNYVYLDPAANCAPASNTTGFSFGHIPLAKVVTSAAAISSVTDVRNWFVPVPCTSDASGAVKCQALGTNQDVSLSPSGTGKLNVQTAGGVIAEVKGGSSGGFTGFRIFTTDPAGKPYISLENASSGAWLGDIEALTKDGGLSIWGSGGGTWVSSDREVKIFAGAGTGGNYDVTISPSGSGTVIVNGNITQPTVPVLNVAAYAPKVVTVPAPTAAPVVAAQDLIASSGTFTAGNTYEVACSLSGYTGESALGPAASFVAVAGQSLAVKCIAPKGTEAIGANIYIRDVTGGGVFRRSYLGGFAGSPVASVAFGDNGAWGGVVVGYNASGATHPGTDNAQSTDGSTSIPAPTSAPTVTTLGALPASTTLYCAFSYVGEDGTETALSPISSGAPTSANSGRWLTIRMPNVPPSGGVFVNVYCGTTNTTAGMKRQLANQPLGTVMHELHTYDSAGVGNTAGTPQSTVSTLQQAIDAIVTAASGGTILVPPGIHETKVPILLKDQTAFGQPVTCGIRISGIAGSATNVAPETEIRYTGTLSGVELVISVGSCIKIEDLFFNDANSRVKYGLVLADFRGGQNYYNFWKAVSFSANATGGVGLFVSPKQRNASGHTGSEQFFEDCTFMAKAWAISLGSSQTTNIKFRDLHTFVSGTATDADSGDLRTFGVPVVIDGWISEGYGQYLALLTNEPAHPFHAGSAAVKVSNQVYRETRDGSMIFAVSPLQVGWLPQLEAEQVIVSNQSGHRGYCYYSGNTSFARLKGTVACLEDVFLNHAQAVLDMAPGYNWSAFKATAPTYAERAQRLYAGRLEFVNESNQVSGVGTNANGDLAFSPSSNMVQFSGAATLKAGGSNQDITLTPTGSGLVRALGGGLYADAVRASPGSGFRWTTTGGSAYEALVYNTASSYAYLLNASPWKTLRTLVNTVTFSATPTFDASLGNTQKITLTGNVTSSTLSNAAAGQWLNFLVCQDATGGRSFAWPSNVKGGMTVGTTASTCSAQSFVYDGTNAYAVSSGSTNM